MEIHWEEVKENSVQIDEVYFDGKDWRRFMYYGPEGEYQWYAFENDNPYSGNPYFIEEGYTPVYETQMRTPGQGYDLYEVTVPNMYIDSSSGNARIDFKLEEDYSELFVSPENYEFAELSTNLNDEVTIDVTVNDREYNDIHISSTEADPVFSITDTGDAFQEDLNISVDVHSNGYTETTTFLYETSVSENIELNLGSEELHQINIPISYEDGIPSGYQTLNVVNHLGVNEYPEVIDSIISIYPEDPDENIMVSELPKVEITLPGVNSDTLEVKWIEEGNGYTLVVDQNFYYNHDTNQTFTHNTSGVEEEFINELPLPMETKDNFGELTYQFSFNMGRNYNVQVTQDIGNTHSLRGDEDSKYIANVIDIEDMDYFWTGAELEYEWEY